MRHFPAFIEKWFRPGITIIMTISLISSAALVLISSRQEGAWAHFTTLNYLGIILAIIALLMSWLCEALRLKIIAGGLGEPISFKKLFNINLISTFTGNITPYASGGIPTQVFLLCKSGAQPGKASALVTLRVIFSALLFTLLVPVLLTLFRSQLDLGWAHQLITIAIPLSCLASLALIALIINPRLAKYLLIFPIWLCKKIPGLSVKVEPHIRKILRQVVIFHRSIKQFRCKRNFIFVFLTTFLYFFALFSIAPAIIFAFGIGSQDIYVKCILLQFVLTFITAYLPIPGGSGVMEAGFLSMFLFIPIQIRGFIALIWRLISYHVPTFTGGVILLRLINSRSLPSEEVQE